MHPAVLDTELPGRVRLCSWDEWVEPSRLRASAEVVRPSVWAAGQPALSAEAQAALDGQLWEAAADEGDAAAIERLAAEGASPNAKEYGTWGDPAVVVAADNGHAGAVSALVRLGAAPDARDRVLGETALIAAARNGKVECARALLAGGADHTLRGTGGPYSGKIALEVAELLGKAEVAALLREAEPAVRLLRSPTPRYAHATVLIHL